MILSARILGTEATIATANSFGGASTVRVYNQNGADVLLTITEVRPAIIKPTALLATAAALPTNTYANGTNGVGATLTASAVGVLTVDGTAVALNDIILVKNEVAGLKNGLYKCTTAGAGGAAYVLTRLPEMDEGYEFANSGVYVTAGTANVGLLFTCTSTEDVVVGTTAITFTSSTPVTRTVTVKTLDTIYIKKSPGDLIAAATSCKMVAVSD